MRRQPWANALVEHVLPKKASRMILRRVCLLRDSFLCTEWPISSAHGGIILLLVKDT